MNPLFTYKAHLSVLIKKYADPVHDEGVTIDEVHSMFMQPMLDVIKKNQDSGKKLSLCAMNPVIEWVQIVDQYPTSPKEYGGGDGGKERFSFSAKINLTTLIETEKKELKRAEAESIINKRIEWMYEEGCELMEYACDFTFLSINLIEKVKKTK